MFGHEKGAFTGAVRQKLGRGEEADGGTIFTLDEIGDMGGRCRRSCCVFTEDAGLYPRWRQRGVEVDVRLIAATNRDIIEAIRQNNFREFVSSQPRRGAVSSAAARARQ